MMTHVSVLGGDVDDIGRVCAVLHRRQQRSILVARQDALLHVQTVVEIDILEIEI